MVYAHNRQDIAKGNEQSNCGEEGGLYPDEYPSLTIEKIECGPDNKLSVTVVVFPAAIKYGRYRDEWEAGGEVYFDGEKMGVFDLINPTRPEEDIDFYSHGSYTYILPWEITAPVMVGVMVHAETVSDGYVTGSDAYKKVLVEPLASTTTTTVPGPTQTVTTTVPGPTQTVTTTVPGPTQTPTIYPTLLLGLIGFGIVLCIGYLKYGTRLFRHNGKPGHRNKTIGKK